MNPANHPWMALTALLMLTGPTPAQAQTTGVIKPARSTLHTRSMGIIPSAFTVRENETLGMYSVWTGISLRQLLLQSGIKEPSAFRKGLVLHLMLSPEQWMRVHTARALKPTQNGGFPAQNGGFKALTPLKPLGRLDVPKPPPPAALQFLVHTVQSGENAAAIAQYYGLDMGVLGQANGNQNFSVLTPGKALYIPNLLGKATPPQARVLRPSVVPAITPSARQSSPRKKTPIIVPVRKAP